MSSSVTEAIQNLPPLRETIKAFGLNANKSLGQHFLLDLNLTAKNKNSSVNVCMVIRIRMNVCKYIQHI
jgi:hypothetical protein